MYRFVKADIDRGLRAKWFVFVIISLLTAVRIVLFDMSINSRLVQLNMNSDISIIDNFFYMFRGMKEYVDIRKNIFEIPDAYLVINLILAVIIGMYPVRDSKGVGILYMLKGESRVSWWLSKCVWNIVSVVVFYISIYIGIMAGSVLYGCISHANVLSDKFNYDIVMLVSNYKVDKAGSIQLLFYIVIMPLIASIAISYIQMLISFIAGQIAGYLFVIIIMCIAAYYMSPFLLGNSMMALRYVLINPDGITLCSVILFSIILSILVILIGSIYFKKKDIT